MKITPKHVQYYGERKFHKHLKNPQISIHQLINPPSRDAFLTDKLNSYKIIRSHYNRTGFEATIKKLKYWRLHGATRQIQVVSARLLRTLRRKKLIGGEI